MCSYPLIPEAGGRIGRWHHCGTCRRALNLGHMRLHLTRSKFKPGGSSHVLLFFATSSKTTRGFLGLSYRETSKAVELIESYQLNYPSVLPLDTMGWKAVELRQKEQNACQITRGLEHRSHPTPQELLESLNTQSADWECHHMQMVPENELAEEVGPEVEAEVEAGARVLWVLMVKQLEVPAAEMVGQGVVVVLIGADVGGVGVNPNSIHKRGRKLQAVLAEEVEVEATEHWVAVEEGLMDQAGGDCREVLWAADKEDEEQREGYPGEVEVEAGQIEVVVEGGRVGSGGLSGSGSGRRGIGRGRGNGRGGRVGGGGVGGAGGQPGRATPNAMVLTDSDSDGEASDHSDSDSDAWDARGILDDIDTGFGIAPQGGLLEVSGYGSD
ncbi:uncharacterized protein STEHIDRAFT_107500 [Stereum hirsutum FP-91666 SS1]|uniref:uncharacterized protein n=1 Tax=Stereum hirsutum (strain FP-91666) TaxID=721885 RepID=UPI000440CB4E|nr:uncharacterized protein STEHIDRAFT_107500 [Stereum hirsutum FP-91666 SS1]EIM90758.1 hypothetical protein STEHIDRAFT_107500 [Stereum hirsutum FP-91666 SS1]